MREVTEQDECMVFCQTSGVGKIPQFIADVLHCRSLHMWTHIHTHTDEQQYKKCYVTKTTARKTQYEEVTHWWYFVSVENKCYAATAVVQMPAVWLALGGCLWRWGSSHGTNPPLMARGGEAHQVAVLQTLPSCRAGLLSLVLTWWSEPAGATTTQHLVPQGQNV